MPNVSAKTIITAMVGLLVTIFFCAWIYVDRASAAEAWTGPYVGVLGSYSTNDFTDTPITIGGKNGGITRSANVDGGLFGLQAGYGKQMGQIYLGAEGDWQWGDMSTDVTDPSWSALHETYKLDEMATFRGRVGYVWGQFMPYVTGGVAIAHDELGAYVTSFPVSVSASQWQVGWTAGGGLEYRPMTNWALKVEALYTDFGTNDLVDGNFGGTGFKAISVKETGTQVRFGAAYKF